MNKIKIGSDMLKLRNYLKKHDINPKLDYENVKYNETKKLWVYTYQAGFETEEEVKMFQLFGNLINTSLMETK